ncbi:MHS family MFS transporter [Brevibacterium sediminis]|uniref:MFS transporter n=1 Tax=Brevibacterium sediminis TaxID=1857024 RepID=UPI0021752600|nr:MFS transporter [Brevibacterium sediminis]MCS4594784.1 MHS family MFS transporter [Brevibacterium sediminis]
MNSNPQPTDVSSFTKKDIRVVMMSCIVGTTVEWYDFFLYGMAAGLVFNKLYFPSDYPLIGTILAFASFAVGFVARPVGGLVFGHIGDRVGRKKTLVTTMMIMGIATFLIGVIPTHAMIGFAAPLLLVICRIAQGVAVGGEWGGAVLMAVEYASKGKRGLYGSFPQIGLAVGLVLGTGVFAFLGGVMSDDSFLSWGWRVAFMFSAVLVGVGLFIRLKVMETPAFAKLEKAEARAVIPAVELAKDRQSRRNIILGMGARWAEGVAFNLWAVFIITYATTSLDVSQGTILTAVMLGAIIMVGVIPLMGRLSDHFDRRRMYALGVVALGILTYPTLLLIGTGNPLLIFISIGIVLGVVYPVVYAPEASLFAELFPTWTRYSGISVVYQISGIVASGMTPLILSYLLRESDGHIGSIVAYVLAVTVISGVSALLIRRTDMFTEDTEDDKHRERSHKAPVGP